MSLRVRFDHRLDRLADALIDGLATPLSDPFAEDVVVVPTLGVGRWLQQRIAQRFGVCARVRIEFAGRLLWQLFAGMLPGLPQRSPFEPAVARWTILALFDDLPHDRDLAPLAQHLQSAGPAERLALAGDVARQFEAYLAYRRDWLARWQRGQSAQEGASLGAHEPWQRWLWCRLLERLPGVSGRHPFDRAGEALERDPRQARQSLGATRIAILGAVGMSPEQLGLFARFGRVIDVAIFAPDPCRELWDDLLDVRSLARVQAERPDVAWLYDNEPSVLGNWGRAQRDFVAQVCALEERVGIQAEAPFRDEATEFETAEESGAIPALTTLQALQTAVFMRSDRPWQGVAAAASDGSLQVHASHSAIRQAEVLHDRLLECFEQIPGLRPGEVAVFCAAVEDAAHAIESVFASAPPEHRIPLSVSGRRPRVEPLVAAVLDLLAVAGRGAPLASLAGWFDNPSVAAGLGLGEEEVGELVGWLDTAGVRWGLDAADGPAKHQWEAALDRMLLGVATGEGCGAVGDIVPVRAPRGDEFDLLDGVLPLVECLRLLREQAREPRPVARWCDCLRRVVERLFGRSRRDADALAGVIDALAGLQADAAAEPKVAIDLAAFAQALGEQLERSATAAIAGGAVTVCGLGGLRGVPFRVVCLFGMDELAYPRRGASAEIDLMARAPRFGDRVARTDDRGVFLDAILAARDRVVILYNGRDPRDDSLRSPSPLVSELLDYVAARVPPESVPAVPELHPLHAFSPRGFRGPRASHASQWLGTARALAVPRGARTEGCGSLVDASAQAADSRKASDAGSGRVADDRVLTLRDVHQALANPAATWLRRALGLRLPGSHLAIDELEPLWDDVKRDRVLVDRTARRLLDGADRERLRAELRASPETAAGVAGRIHADQVLARAQALVEIAIGAANAAGNAADAGGAGGLAAKLGDVASATADGHAELRIALDDGDGELILACTVDTSASSQALVSGFPLGPSALIEAWLAHAVRLRVQAAQGASDASLARAVTCLAAADATVTLRGPQAGAALDRTVLWARRIRREALPLFPRTSLAYHRSREDMAKAHSAMFGDSAGRSTPEVDRPWNAALYRDAAPELEAVVAIGREVYGPIFEACEVRDRVRR